MIHKEAYQRQVMRKKALMSTAMHLLPASDTKVDKKLLETHYAAEVRDLARKVAELSNNIDAMPQFHDVLLKQLASEIEPYQNNFALLTIVALFYLDNKTGILHFPEQLDSQLSEK